MTGGPNLKIDHLLTYVRDLEQTAAQFRRMGFTLSPVSRIETMGIANHLVLMRPRTPGGGNYIELMSAHDRARLPPAMARTLAGDEGIKSMVLSTADAQAAQAALRAQGFDVGPPAHVRREWRIGPGQSVFPEFDVILPVDAPLVFNCCRYFNVELYLREEWLDHANSAQRMRAVLAVAERPLDVAASFAGVFGSVVTGTPDVARLSSGDVDLVVMSPATLRERYGLNARPAVAGACYVGYVIEAASLDRLTACLAQAGVEYRSAGGAVHVGPEAGFGNLVVFEAERS
jgi:hypothetical protein